MITSLLATLLLPLALAQELDLELAPQDPIRLGRIHSRVEQYRRGDLEVPVPAELQPVVELASQLGGQIYRLDTAALKASAALTRVGAVEDPRLQGWLCVDGGEQVHVIFVGIDPAEPTSPGGLHHAVVDLKGGTVQWSLSADDGSMTLAPSPGQAPADLLPLGGDLLQEWQAHQAVLQAYPGAAEMPVDPVVVQVDATPGAEAYIVFLLARSLDPQRIQFGGHTAMMVRFQEGKLGLKPFVQSRDSLAWDRQELMAARDEGEVLHGFFRSSDEVPAPRELHVYESLVYELPFFMLAQDNLWHVEGVKLSYLGKVRR